MARYSYGMLEHHTDPLLPRAKFLLRAFWFLFLSATVVATALGVGVLGYY